MTFKKYVNFFQICSKPKCQQAVGRVRLDYENSETATIAERQRQKIDDFDVTGIPVCVLVYKSV